MSEPKASLCCCLWLHCCFSRQYCYPSPLITHIISFHRATTVLVLTLGSGVHGFTLDPDKQTFLQTHPNMRIPDVGSLYSFNEANSREFSEPVQQFLEKMKESGKIG